MGYAKRLQKSDGVEMLGFFAEVQSAKLSRRAPSRLHMSYCEY